MAGHFQHQDARISENIVHIRVVYQSKFAEFPFAVFSLKAVNEDSSQLAYLLPLACSKASTFWDSRWSLA